MNATNLIILFMNILTTFWTKIRFVEGIIGGYDAKPGQFKYQVSILANKNHVCGGAIISDRLVLSAAHCFLDAKSEFMEYDWSVLGGVITSTETTSNRIEMDVKKIYIPIEYKTINCENDQDIFDCSMQGDIAVLRMENGFKLCTNRFIAKVNLPQKRDAMITYVGMEPIISAFGSKIGSNDHAIKSHSGTIDIIDCSDHVTLMYGKSKVISNHECQTAYINSILPTHLCAQIIQENSIDFIGTCQGDSGSPLVLNDNTVIGVLVSRTVGFSEKVKPSVYTRVVDYLDFINKAMLDEHSSHIRTATYKIEKIAGFITKVWIENKNTRKN